MGPFHRGRLFAPPRRRRWWWILILFPAVLTGFSAPLRPDPEPQRPEWLPAGYVAHRGPDGRWSYRMRRPRFRRLLNRLHLRVRWPKRTQESGSSEEREPVGTTRHGVPIFVAATDRSMVAGWRPIWQRKHSPKGWPVAWKPIFAVFGAAAVVGSAAGGNWNTNGAWTGGVQPTAADDVTLTAASGNITIPSGVTAVCRSIDCTGYLGTLTFAATTSELDVGDASGGALQFVSTMTLTLTGIGLIKFVSTTASTTYSLTTGGKTMPNVTVATGSTTTIQAADSWTCGATATVTLTTGTLNTNGQTCSWGAFSSSGSGTRTLTLGASAITMTGSSSIWNMGSTTNMTMTANTAVVTTTNHASTTPFNIANGFSTNGMSIVLNGAGNPTISGAQFGSITRTGTAVKTDGLTINNAMTVTGQLLLTGNSLTNRLLVQSSTVGTTRTFTVNGSHGAHANVDFMDITIAGTAGNLSGTSIGDALGNSGITFTGGVTRYGVVAGNWSSTATWSATDGGAGGASVPLPQDSVILNGNSAAGTYTADMPRLGKDITCTGFTRTLSITTAGGPSLYGNLTFASGMSLSWTTGLFVRGRGAQTITNAGQAWGRDLSLTCPGGTYTLQDALTSTQGINHNNGGFDANGYNVTAATVTSSSGNTRTLSLGTGTWTVTGTGTAWNVAAAGLTLNQSTSIIDLTNTSATAKTFAGGGKTYATLRCLGVAGKTVGSVTVTGANTFDTITMGAGVELILPASTTTTILTALNVAGATTGYVYLPGVSGQYISAPDSAALSITGDIDIRCKVALDDWTPAAQTTLVAKWNSTGNQRSYRLDVDIAGKLNLFLSSDGAAIPSAVSSVATGVADGAVKWVRATWVDSTDTAKFFTSDDGVAWTQLGTNQSLVSAGLFDSTAPLEVGSITTGTLVLATGKFYRAQVRNNVLDDGTGIQFDADFTTKAFGANSFVESSTNAATVTINGTAAQCGDGRVFLHSSTGGTQATLSKAAGTVIADYMVVQDSAATGGANFYATHSVKGSNVTGWYVGQIVTLGQATVANAGQPLRAQHAVELGEAVVTNAGLPAAARKQVNLGEAVAANAGLPVVPTHRRTVGEAQEADTGALLRAQHAVELARAAEADAGLGATARHRVNLGEAQEADQGFAAAVRHLVAVGEAQEADSGRLLAAVKRALLGLSAEADVALAPRALHRVGLGLAVEIDRAVGLVQIVVVGPAIEHDEALSAAFPPVIIRLNASNGHVLPLLASWARTLSFPRSARV